MINMVKLLVDDLERTVALEQALINANIEYSVELDNGRYGIKTPYLLVYNAPLDEPRALKWIGEKR